MASNKNLKIVMKSPADLIPYVNNAKIHEPEQIDLIASSMKEFGFTNPILLDGDNGLIAGHGRLMAANKLGLEKVPTIELSHLTPHQKRAYILADNRVAELHTSWDMELVELELKDLELDGFDLDDLEFEIDSQEEMCEGLTDPDETPEVDDTREPVSQRGMVWLCGDHRVMCGDSTSEEDITKLMAGNNADMVFTDPPYGVSIVSESASEEVGGSGVPKFGKVGGGGVVEAKDYAQIIGDDTTDTAREFYNACISVGLDRFIIWGG